MLALTKEIQELEQRHKATPEEAIRQRLEQLKIQLKVLETKQVAQQIPFPKQRFFQHGNNPGKCLTNLLKPNGVKIKIPSIITKEGIELTVKQDKLKEFERFYTKLYQTDNPEQKEIENILEGLDIKKLTEAQVIMIEKPIHHEEIKFFIHKMHGNSAPSVDGFTAEFYKTFIEEFGYLYNYILQVKSNLASWNEAKNVLIPKPYKDQKYVESYRPISLLNFDYIILASILGARLNRVIGTLICHERTGFITNHEMKDNIRKVLNILDMAKNKNVSLICFFAVSEKSI